MFYAQKKDEEKEKMCSQSRFPEWTEFLEKSTRISAASNFKFPNNCFGLWFVRAGSGSGNWNLSLVCVISRHSVEQVILNLKTLRIISTNKNISIAFTRVKILYELHFEQTILHTWNRKEMWNILKATTLHATTESKATIQKKTNTHKIQLFSIKLQVVNFQLQWI